MENEIREKNINDYFCKKEGNHPQCNKILYADIEETNE